MEMASPVRILMSAKTMCTIAVFMHTAITLSVLIIVLVSPDSKAMDCPAMTSMNVKRIRTTAVLMHSVGTLSARMTVSATQVT